MVTQKVKKISDYINDYMKVRQKPQGGLLRFYMPDGRDVYNCSTPFVYNGKTYIWGRVENRLKWATSVTFLFERDKDGTFVRVNDCESYPLEDPFFLRIGDEYILGGTHVVKEKSNIRTYYVYFYRGKSPFSLEYFTTGPDYMKDIRLIGLQNGKIGVFSRPRCDSIMEQFGTVSQIGYTEINSLNELDADVISKAGYIPGLFAENEWGGVNQTVALKDGLIGLVGHQGYPLVRDNKEYPVYVNTAYVYDPSDNDIVEKKIIGVRDDYPETESKLPALIHCAFTSGIVDENDGKVRLYSGLGDAHEGWIRINDPFFEYRQQ